MFEYLLMFLALCVVGWLNRHEGCAMNAECVRIADRRNWPAVGRKS